MYRVSVFESVCVLYLLNYCMILAEKECVCMYVYCIIHVYIHVCVCVLINSQLIISGYEITHLPNDSRCTYFDVGIN